ncbi:hypothetical protein NliqN6_4365 [Naganishia liquefaciens]|uniref:Peptidase M48 domain-containing protein n=1 Tax=Naganishia liquefaciens TaxID=104408 RepID=A0A8H3TW49_9TREE|nr:hypothetical protein NliqN6_4365 [Naganishia liquefaciens]
MITRTTPKRPLPLPTFWAAQVHVIGEILGARRATGIGAAKTMIRRNPTTTTTTMVIRRLDTQRTTTTTGPVRFRGWSGTRDRIRIPHHHQGQVDFLRRPLGIPAMQIRAFHASRPSNLPAPAVIFGLGALLKSTGAWAIFSVLSRILFTLIPVSLMASRKISMKGAKYAANHAPVDIAPHVRKFFHTFCEAEACKRPARRDMWRIAEARGIQGLSGRKVIACPSANKDRRAVFEFVYRDTVNVSRQRTGLAPLPAADIHFPESRHAMWVTPFFYLPKLEPAALKALEKLSTEEREQLFELRCHEGHRGAIAAKVKKLNRLFVCFVVLPFMVFAATAILSLERTPYSGRWRFIMLSPEEEDVISSRLRGPGWYQTVISLLTTPEAPAPPIVPVDDWRWHWVNSVLRRLEAGVLAECANGWQGDTARGKGYAVPPPPEHPLHPRPRAACFLHAAVPGSSASEKTGTEHLAVGPPYSLLLLQDDERNALSMGWGSDGAGGVVVYSGLLEEILGSTPPPPPPPPPADAAEEASAPTGAPASPSWFRALFGSSPQRPSPPVITHASPPVPTEEQTIRLACVLAHELAHLLLAHHLEALSASQVLIPNVTGLASDLIRTLIFPVTMILGPFVNDFISDVSRRGMDQTKVLSDICFSRHQEREADLVSLRLLAYSGFSPEEALKFWDGTPKALCGKEPVSPITDTEPYLASDASSDTASPFPRRPLTFFRGSTHDTDAERLAALTREIERWKVYAERHPAGASMAHMGLREWAGRLVGYGSGAQRSPAGGIAT